jgi:mRNA interferase YafQ
MAKTGKRAAHPGECDCTKAFSKGWARLSVSGTYNMHRLKEAMLLLIANDSPLGPEWKDHPLKGERASFRECHIGGDFLLIYKIDDTAGKCGMVVFTRTGTHSELFRE